MKKLTAKMILAKCNRVGDLTVPLPYLSPYLPIGDIAILVAQYALSFNEGRFEEILYREMVRYRIPEIPRAPLLIQLRAAIQNHRNPLIRCWFREFDHALFFSMAKKCSRPRCWMGKACICEHPLTVDGVRAEVQRMEHRRRKARKRLL